MCDIQTERNNIDAVIEQNISPFWYADIQNLDTLIEVAFRCLRDDYGDFCTEDCIRSRCQAYIAWRIGRPVA